MNYKAETENFLKNLERVAQVRVEVANCLEQMAETIELAELEGKISSGGLGLTSQLEDIKAVENNLRQGVFRLLVLGDMKRGKNNFLNALIGENLLPNDVDPWTAILAILRYGKEKKVTVYFNDDTKPEQLDFQQFKQAYTLASSEAKQLEQDEQQAFPNVSHALVEYPLPLLEKGIEIIDSPGLNDTEARLEETGFPEFLGSLNTFLTKERAIAQLRQARTIARQAYTRTHEAIERRIPLLEQDVDRLKRKINSVEPEFKKLTGIRDRFQQEIRSTRDIQAKGIADSFRNYILNLGNTFENDFLRYQPDLQLFDFLSKNKREAFNAALQKAFDQYINDKLSNWTLSTEKSLNTAFAQLTVSAARCGEFYSQITEEITEKITEQKVVVNSNSTVEDDNTPAWTKWAMGLFSLTRGNLSEVTMAGAGFDWKNSLLNYVAVIGISNIISAVTRIFLEPLELALIRLDVGFVQADRARQELVKMTENELIKHLPQVASEQWLPVYNGVKEYFDAYAREVTKRIEDDIRSRKSELDNLVKQKETFEINRDAEVQRLQKLDGEVAVKSQQIERIFQKLSIASA
ncbi:dynamin family protein [Scytonema millei]|uniref:Dynamin n=1 Tax=Scytonema millei VB511283 TaxID=1245923 RepID=A0A9X5EDT9_9CYAN|nr:dynamin family protein [Scytonema millei]NHC37977.1 dynamin [Scytonema millei VB511283]